MNGGRQKLGIFWGAGKLSFIFGLENWFYKLKITSFCKPLLKLCFYLLGMYQKFLSLYLFQSKNLLIYLSHWNFTTVIEKMKKISTYHHGIEVIWNIKRIFASNKLVFMKILQIIILNRVSHKRGRLLPTSTPSSCRTKNGMFFDNGLHILAFLTLAFA